MWAGGEKRVRREEEEMEARKGDVGGGDVKGRKGGFQKDRG